MFRQLAEWLLYLDSLTDGRTLRSEERPTVPSFRSVARSCARRIVRCVPSGSFISHGASLNHLTGGSLVALGGSFEVSSHLTDRSLCLDEPGYYRGRGG
jgi:hypothetical protein